MAKKKAANLLPKLTEVEQDLLSHIQDGYQLETDSLGGNPILRRLDRQRRNTSSVCESQYHQGDGKARAHYLQQRSRPAHYSVASEKENKLGPVFRVRRKISGLRPSPRSPTLAANLGEHTCCLYAFSPIPFNGIEL